MRFHCKTTVIEGFKGLVQLRVYRHWELLGMSFSRRSQFVKLYPCPEYID